LSRGDRLRPGARGGPADAAAVRSGVWWLLPREPAKRGLLEAVLLAGLVAVPLLPVLGAAAALLVLSLLWLAVRPARERRIAGPILALAVAVLVSAWAVGRRERESRAEWKRETRQAYAHLWEDLRKEAATAASALGRPEDTPAARL